MRELDELFTALQTSAFRRRLQLSKSDAEYLNRRPPQVIRRHAIQFVTERLAPAQPIRDGRQTPWRGHPVFTAQHGTATCCRECLRRWHRIPRNRPLTSSEVRYVVRIIERWLRARRAITPGPAVPRQQRLFDKTRQESGLIPPQ